MGKLLKGRLGFQKFQVGVMIACHPVSLPGVINEVKMAEMGTRNKEQNIYTGGDQAHASLLVYYLYQF